MKTVEPGNSLHDATRENLYAQVITILRERIAALEAENRRLKGIIAGSTAVTKSP